MDNRYITIYDSRIPFPIKEYTIPVTESGSYVNTVEQVCETLCHIDRMLEDMNKAASVFYGDEN